MIFILCGKQWMRMDGLGRNVYVAVYVLWKWTCEIVWKAKYVDGFLTDRFGWFFRWKSYIGQISPCAHTFRLLISYCCETNRNFRHRIVHNFHSFVWGCVCVCVCVRVALSCACACACVYCAVLCVCRLFGERADNFSRYWEHCGLFWCYIGLRQEHFANILCARAGWNL